MPANGSAVFRAIEMGGSKNPKKLEEMTGTMHQKGVQKLLWGLSQVTWWASPRFVYTFSPAMWGFCFSCSIPPPPPPPPPPQHHQHIIYTTPSSLRKSPERSAEVRRRLSTMRRLRLRGRCSTWRTSVILRCRRSTWSTSVSFCVDRNEPAQQKKHHAAEPSTWGQHSYALVLAQPSYPSAHLHITIYTTPSTQHHLHNTIYTTSSTQHHLH